MYNRLEGKVEIGIEKSFKFNTFTTWQEYFLCFSFEKILINEASNCFSFRILHIKLKNLF